MKINSNIPSLNAQRHFGENTRALARALERLASGKRINRAGDDASGLALSEGLSAQSRGLYQAARNANDSIAFFRTAESALQTQSEIVMRMRELALQAANGTLDATARGFLNRELEELYAEFGRLSDVTSFGDIRLLDGSFESIEIQVGNNKNESIELSLDGYTSEELFSFEETAGSGQYSASTSFSAGHSVFLTGQLYSEDLNGDGFEDLVYVNRVIGLNSQIDIHIADGQGGYQLQNTYSFSGLATDLKLKDINGDGKLDIALALLDQSLHTYLGEGDGSFTFAQSEADIGFVDFGDVNQDGLIDRLEVSYDTGTAEFETRLALGVGNGEFSESKIILESSINFLNTVSADLVDLDGDGDLDIVYGQTDSFFSNPLRAIKNQGQLEFGTAANLSGLSSTGDPELVDINEDGRLDVIKGNGSSLQVFLQEASGSFTQVATIAGSPGTITQIELGDYDSDGLVDVFALDSSGRVSSYRGEGLDGSFSFVNTTTTGGQGFSLTVTDSNIDGALDFITTSAVTDNVILTKGIPIEYTRRPGQDFEIDIGTQEEASDLIEVLDRVATNINQARSNMGAFVNRLETSVNSILINRENLETARSQVIDADYAHESAELIKLQILQQASQAVLSQANFSIQNVLRLLDF